MKIGSKCYYVNTLGNLKQYKLEKEKFKRSNFCRIIDANNEKFYVNRDHIADNARQAIAIRKTILLKQKLSKLREIKDIDESIKLINSKRDIREIC